MTAKEIEAVLDLADKNCLTNVAYWHIATFAATHHFVAYWGNSGQRSARRLNGSAANDPKQTSQYLFSMYTPFTSQPENPLD
jgi:hypothetical protein